MELQTYRREETFHSLKPVPIENNEEIPMSSTKLKRKVTFGFIILAVLIFSLVIAVMTLFIKLSIQFNRLEHKNANIESMTTEMNQSIIELRKNEKLQNQTINEQMELIGEMNKTISSFNQLLEKFIPKPGPIPMTVSVPPSGSDGNVCQNGTCIKGNSHYVSNDTIAMEVNMNLPIRTVHLFINGKQQPVFMSGLPSEIRIDFYIETVGETLTLISLDYLEKPTIVKLTDEIEAKWEI